MIRAMNPLIAKSSHNIPDCGPQFPDLLAEHDLKLARAEPMELQLNLGKLCNLACHHCHVDAGPQRTELMTWATMAKVLDWLPGTAIRQIDLTGGAPELNPQFRQFCDALLGPVSYTHLTLPTNREV